MNIQEAKQQIKNAIIAYSSKDEYGYPLIPGHKQRPIFLVGAPGIGKTAIMEQLSQELDIALVSYSMTHHTRQSALGLPFIVDKEYGDTTYKVSEYTMSEIIASIYDTIEASGKENGILFLDEINCISETLAPSMLQFLQYKTFGRHKVPEGWIVVTAGNPAEYNNSVKEYDVAMWDRLKKIEVEADYEVWKEYAINTKIHPVVTSYLNIKSNNFYSIETTLDGKSFVTARGWDDLSQMIILYELNNIEVDHNLISQYLQNEKIAKDFSHYYQLFHKYQADYKVESILDGTTTQDIAERASNAKFDERLSLISLIMSQIEDTVSKTVVLETIIKAVMAKLKAITAVTAEEYINSISDIIKDISSEIKKNEVAGALSEADKFELHGTIAMLNKIISALNTNEGNAGDVIKGVMQTELTRLKASNETTQNALNNAFTFCEDVFDKGQEILILVTEMTINSVVAKYIYSHGCKKYYDHNKQLLFENTHQELMDKIDAINLLEFEQ